MSNSTIANLETGLEAGMQCILCQAEIPPITGGSDTRTVLIDAAKFAACGSHFPLGGASEAEYTAAYDRFLRAALQATGIEVSGASLFADEAGLFTVAPAPGPGHGDS